MDWLVLAWEHAVTLLQPPGKGHPEFSGLKRRANKISLEEWSDPQWAHENGFAGDALPLVSIDAAIRSAGSQVEKSRAPAREFGRLIDMLKNGTIVRASLSGHNAPVSSSISGKELGLGTDQIHFFSCDAGQARQSLVIEDINVCHLTSGGAKIFAKNCVIGFLSVSKKTNLNIEHCLIGRIIFSEKGINNLRIVDSVVKSLFVNPIEARNLISGAAIVNRTSFVTSHSESRFYDGPQSFRVLRSNFETTDNQSAAHLLRGLTLRSEREADTGIMKVVSVVYGATANYGLNPGRAVALILVLYIAAVGMIFVFDGGSLTVAYEGLSGWQTSLSGSDARIERSALLPIQSFLNPFGILGRRSLLVASTPLGQLVLGVHGFLNTMLLAILVISIRRRFKIGS